MPYSAHPFRDPAAIMFLEGLMDKIQPRHTDFRLPNSIIYYSAEKTGEWDKGMQVAGFKQLANHLATLATVHRRRQAFPAKSFESGVHEPLVDL